MAESSKATLSEAAMLLDGELGIVGRSRNNQDSFKIQHY